MAKNSIIDVGIGIKQLNLFNSKVEELGATMGNIATNFQTNIATLGNQWKPLTASFNDVKGSIGEVKNSFAELNNDYDKTKNAIVSLESTISNSYTKIEGSLNNSIDSFKSFGVNTLNNIQTVKDSFGGLKSVLDNNAVANYAYQAGIAEIGEELNILQQTQAQLGMAFSSGKEIVGGFTNTFVDLQNQWTTAKETYSTLKDSILGIKTSYSDLKSNLVTVKDGLLSFKGVVGSTGKKSLEFAKNLSTSVLQGVSSFGSSIVSSVTTAFPALVSGLGGAIASTWAFTTALLANPITWIVAGVIGLGIAIWQLATHWDVVKEKLVGGFNIIKEKVSAVFTWFKGILEGAPDWLQFIIAPWTLIIEHFDLIKEKIGAGVDWLKEKFVGIKNWIASKFDIGSALRKLMQKVVNIMPNWLKSFLGIENKIVQVNAKGLDTNFKDSDVGVNRREENVANNKVQVSDNRKVEIKIDGSKGNEKAVAQEVRNELDLYFREQAAGAGVGAY